VAHATSRSEPVVQTAGGVGAVQNNEALLETVGWADSTETNEPPVGNVDGEVLDVALHNEALVDWENMFPNAVVDVADPTSRTEPTLQTADELVDPSPPVTADAGGLTLHNEPGVDGANGAAGSPPNPTAVLRP